MSMVNIPSTITDPSYRYKMPKLAVKVEGKGNGVKTAMMNILDLATALKRPASEICKFMGCELGSQTRFTEKSTEGTRALVMGKHDASHMCDLMDKYCEIFICCPECKLPELNASVKNSSLHARCLACGYSGRLEEATAHKLCAFIVKEAAEAAKGGTGSLPANATKAERKAARQAAKEAKRAAKDDDDDDDEDDSDAKKKKKKDKKKKKKDRDDDDEDVSEGDEKEKKKKKKKEKKASKKESKISQDSEEEETDDEEDIKHVIEKAMEYKDAGAEELFDELRGSQIARGFDNVVRLFAGLEILFGADDDGDSEKKLLNQENLEAKSEHVGKLVQTAKMNTMQVMQAFEHYYLSHEEACKGKFALVCKVLYDEDLIVDSEFVGLYGSSGKGSKKLKSELKQFVDWLEESDSESDSDSD